MTKRREQTVEHCRQKRARDESHNVEQRLKTCNNNNNAANKRTGSAVGIGAAKRPGIAMVAQQHEGVVARTVQLCTNGPDGPSEGHGLDAGRAG